MNQELKVQSKGRIEICIAKVHTKVMGWQVLKYRIPTRFREIIRLENNKDTLIDMMDSNRSLNRSEQAQITLPIDYCKKKNPLKSVLCVVPWIKNLQCLLREAFTAWIAYLCTNRLVSPGSLDWSTDNIEKDFLVMIFTLLLIFEINQLINKKNKFLLNN